MEDGKQNLHETLGNYLKARRKEAGMTQEDLGVAVGYSQQAAKQAISQLERGINWIPITKQEKIIAALRLDPKLISLLNDYYSEGKFNEALAALNRHKKAEQQLKTREISINLNKSFASPPATDHSGESVLEAKLRKLKSLFDAGLIDEDDYRKAKHEALSKFLE